MPLDLWTHINMAMMQLHRTITMWQNSWLSLHQGPTSRKSKDKRWIMLMAHHQHGALLCGMNFTIVDRHRSCQFQTHDIPANAATVKCLMSPKDVGIHILVAWSRSGVTVTLSSAAENGSEIANRNSLCADTSNRSRTSLKGASCMLTVGVAHCCWLAGQCLFLLVSFCALCVIGFSRIG